MRVDDAVFQRVENFKYLGVMINEENDLDVEIKARALAGMRAYYSLDKAFRSKAVSVGAKARLYATVARPAMTYGAETWTLKAPRVAKITATENKILYKVAGPRYIEALDLWAPKPYAEMRALTKIPPIVHVVKRMRLQYCGHVARGSAPCATCAVLNDRSPHAKGSRPIGGRPNNYRDQVREDAARVLGDPDARWQDAAQDREEWRAPAASASSPSPTSTRRSYVATGRGGRGGAGGGHGVGTTTRIRTTRAGSNGRMFRRIVDFGLQLAVNTAREGASGAVAERHGEAQDWSQWA